MPFCTNRIVTQSNPKIQGKFYPLQHEEWLRACRELTPAQRDVLYYIRTIDPAPTGQGVGYGVSAPLNPRVWGVGKYSPNNRWVQALALRQAQCIALRAIVLVGDTSSFQHRPPSSLHPTPYTLHPVVDPYNQGIVINAAEVARQLSGAERIVHRQTVSRALRELVDKGYLPDSFRFKLAPSDNIERQICARLKAELDGEVEVITAVGRIDLLTESEVIEIKEINNWKEALDKILAYSAFFPERSKRIHLFGNPNLAKLALAQATCSEFAITITFEEVQS